MLPGPSAVGHAYIARVRVRHDDLDAFGRAYPSAYLRHLAQIAIDASTDAGFDAAWYATAGARWLVNSRNYMKSFCAARLPKCSKNLNRQPSKARSFCSLLLH